MDPGLQLALSELLIAAIELADQVKLDIEDGIDVSQDIAVSLQKFTEQYDRVADLLDILNGVQ